jgi:F-type H+-transporting ATPase subunit b
MKRRLAGKQAWRPVVLIILILCCFLSATSIIYASQGEGEETDHGDLLKDYAWRMLNFAILAFIIYKLTWQKLKEFFIGRREGVKEAMAEAVKAKEEAKAKFKEYSERLEKASGEIDGISEMIKAQGASEKEKLIESAKRAAEKMKEDSRARVEQDMKKAANQLRVEASKLAVEMAEEMLSKTIKKEDHERLVKESLDRMVKLN